MMLSNIHKARKSRAFQSVDELWPKATIISVYIQGRDLDYVPDFEEPFQIVCVIKNNSGQRTEIASVPAGSGKAIMENEDVCYRYK